MPRPKSSFPNHDTDKERDIKEEAKIFHSLASFVITLSIVLGPTSSQINHIIG